MKKVLKERRGGKRPGAGRKKTNNAKKWARINCEMSTFEILKKLKNDKNCKTYNELLLALISQFN